MTVGCSVGVREKDVEVWFRVLRVRMIFLGVVVFFTEVQIIRLILG